MIAKTPRLLVSNGSCDALAGQDETFVIQRDAAVEPLGVGIGANESSTYR